ncbi:hypothetical protein ScPMuIL_016384 [Solemya velum]
MTSVVDITWTELSLSWIVVGTWTEVTRIPLEEERLIDNLLDGYGTYARPAHNQSVAVRVGHSFELLYVTAKEEHEGQTIVVETTNWLTTDWTDIRLQWDPREYAGIKTISLAPKQIWTPDIVLFNSYGSLDTRHQGYLVLIEHTGAVKWIPSTKLTVSCPADDNHYACKWTFGSWVHNGYELDLYTPQKSMGVAHYTPNPDWEVSNTSAKREVKHYPCCPEPYIDILYTMDIVKTGTRKKGEKPKDRQRKLFSHVIQDSGDVEVERHGSDLTHVLLLPTVIVSLLVPVQFLVPPESSQRVTVLTILLVALVGMFFVMHGAGHKLLESTIDLDHFYYVSIVWGVRRSTAVDLHAAHLPVGTQTLQGPGHSPQDFSQLSE